MSRENADKALTVLLKRFCSQLLIQLVRDHNWAVETEVDEISPGIIVADVKECQRVDPSDVGGPAAGVNLK